MKSTPILRSTRRDWIATGVITALCAAALGGAYLTADIRESNLVQTAVQGDQEVRVLAQAPSAVVEAFRKPNKAVAGQFKPVVSHGLLIVTDGHTVSAVKPDGSQAWAYSRKQDEVCGLGSAWDKVVIAYRTGVGCGDVVAIDAAHGQYANTRSAINSDDVVTIESNDRVGTVSPQRVEIWRSDMVRTVEYGFVQAKQEPDLQLHEACTISSALTRKENLAVTDSCPEDPNATTLRFLKATPEDARKPEVTADVPLPDGARLIAVSEDSAAVYVPGNQPQVLSYNNEGQQLAASLVEPSPAVTQAGTPFAPATSDLPHHMSWFDGQRLYLLSPETLAMEFFVPDVLGTGVAVGDKLLVPVQEGIAVVNWSNSSIERTIAVDRGDYRGEVHLTMAGTNLVETRGNEVVALKPAG